MIEVENLVKSFGPRRAVDDVSFSVEPGTVLGFLGPNGAGKTTTIRMIAGFLTPTSGQAKVMGQVVEDDPAAAQCHIGYMPENSPLYGDMTVEGLLAFAGELRGLSGEKLNDRINEVLDLCFLQPVRRQTIETLSKGYRQRACMAQALIHDPPVLLLDEPTEGLDPNQKQVVRDMILNMGKEKIIILSTHVLEEVEAICSRVIIISEGKLVVDSNPAELKKRSDRYNQVTLHVVAPLEEAKSAFGGIGDVQAVEVVSTDNDTQVLRLIPKEQQPVAAQALDVARDKNWLITDMQTESGRLEDVFRQVTTTADVG